MSITIRSAQTIRNGLLLKGNHDLYEGIILWLDANNSASYPGSGGMWYDLSPNHYDATLVNAPTFDTNSISFDYTQSQFAVIPAANMFNGDMTAIGWVYVRTDQTWARLFDFGNGSGGVNVIIAVDSNGQNLPAYSTDGSDNIYSPTQLPLNQWVQIVATQSSLTGSIYINGQLVISASNTGIASVVRNYNYIGRSNWNGDAYLDGKISSLRIWSRVLGLEEITADYNTMTRELG